MKDVELTWSPSPVASEDTLKLKGYKLCMSKAKDGPYKEEVEKLKGREDILLGFHNILGKSKEMVGIFHIIEEVALHNTNILI